VLDRGAVWQNRRLPSNFVVDYPLIVRTAVALHGGAIRVELLDPDEAVIVSVWIAASANLRGTTSLCWRGGAMPRPVAGAPWGWRSARLLHKPCFDVFGAVDGAAIAALLVAPSRDLELAFAALKTQEVPDAHFSHA
jgi:hypothetical protein